MFTRVWINNILRNNVKIVLLAKPNRFNEKYSQNTCVYMHHFNSLDD